MTKIENKNSNVQNKKNSFIYNSHIQFPTNLELSWDDSVLALSSANTLLTVRFNSSTPFAPTQAPPYHAFWSQVIDFYGFRITDTDLQKITKTEVEDCLVDFWLL